MTHFKRHSLSAAALLLMATGAAQAGQMTFSQIPPGAGATEPAPNIIVSVDDSGSMGWDINGCLTSDFDTGYYGFITDPNRPAGAPACPNGNSALPSRISSLRSALVGTFGDPSTGTTGIISDDRIRLGWQTMWDNGKSSRPTGQNNDQSALQTNKTNSVKSFSGPHRTAFNNFIKSLKAKQGTPSHKMMANVFSYMSATGADGPFAAKPSTTGSPYLSCRRSYHILMTDGAWNSEDQTSAKAYNFDGTARTLPDGTSYLLDSQTRLYRDSYGDNKGTLADWAMKNWATDFQTLTNDVRALKPVENTVTVGGIALAPYWNPKNNPMTWQGVTQYTIGFGNTATYWGTTPAWDASTDDNYGGDYPNLVNGTANWLDLFSGGSLEFKRPSDLWHAALNGRGKYFPARSPDDLKDAFEDILSDILSQTAKPRVSIATSSTRLTTNAFAYIAKYNSENWTGDLSAYALNGKTGLPSTNAAWTASTLMDSASTATFDPSTRVVLTHDGSVGKGFKWGNLSSDQKSLLRNGTTDDEELGKARLNFIRGDRTKEARETGGYLRNRASRMGDIVNSNIWYTGKPLRMDTDYSGHDSFRTSKKDRTPIVYVGANDGMLHGFNAKTGEEVLAYVPLGAYAKLRNFTQTGYTHQYFVDGHPFTGDAYSSGWKTFLVGTLGAGGKGYFILDVTSGAFADPGSADSSVVVKDETATTDGDIGHIFAAPTVDNGTQTISQQIVKLNNNRWAVLMGNGYNSTNERPVLLIQYLSGSKELDTIVADSDTGETNGLGAPRAVDIDGNGTMDVVYAGDLKGNLWKFNLVSTDESDWGVSNWSGDTVCSNSPSCVPLFVAKTSGGATQPITAAPVALTHPYGGKQIMFGTGKDLIASDRSASSPQGQTVYSVWDKTTYALNSSNVLSSNGSGARISTGRSALVEQTVTGTANGLVSTSTNTVAYSISDSSAKRGWYLDLPVSGERVLANPLYLGESTVLVGSVVPKEAIEGETCDLSSAVDKGYITALNAISGKGGSTPLFGEAAPTATRTAFGTGEFASLTDIKNGRQRAISSDANCTGTDCSSNPSTGPGTGSGASCVGGSGCVVTSCPAGQTCDDGVAGAGSGPSTSCSGEGCYCNGKICQCVTEPCDCTGPACVASTCGTVIPGAIADLCIPGLFGARTDWRELR